MRELLQEALQIIHSGGRRRERGNQALPALRILRPVFALLIFAISEFPPLSRLTNRHREFTVDVGDDQLLEQDRKEEAELLVKGLPKGPPKHDDSACLFVPKLEQARQLSESWTDAEKAKIFEGLSPIFDSFNILF